MFIQYLNVIVGFFRHTVRILNFVQIRNQIEIKIIISNLRKINFTNNFIAYNIL